MQYLPMVITFMCAVLLVAACTDAPQNASSSDVEMRGIWLTNVDSDVLDSREGIDEAMAFLAEHNFNTVFPVVWHNGSTLYPSTVMDTTFSHPMHPEYENRDPLAEVIEAAHRHDMAVIPWFEFGFSADNDPDGPGHILQKRPEWAARDTSGAILKKNGFRWMNAYHPEVQDFIRALVREVAETYDIEGIQGDDRLPAQPVEGGYADYTQERYQKAHNGASPPPDPHDEDWKRWRASLLNDFAEDLYAGVKAIDSSLYVSWSPSVYPWSYNEYLQDWPSWIEGDYADVVHPQVYRRDSTDYRTTLQSLHPDSIGVSPAAQEIIYPGVLIKAGDYVIDADVFIESLKTNRQLGYEGEVLFFYEGLRANNDTLADTLRATLYSDPAQSPLRP